MRVMTGKGLEGGRLAKTIKHDIEVVVDRIVV